MTSTASRILVVDDDPASSDLVAYFLKSLGYQVAIAPDGSRALNMDLEDDVELVILDVHMPRYEGPEVLAMLRAGASVRPFRVIAVTGDDSTDVRVKMLDLGIDAFLTKPVDLDALGRVVHRLMPAGRSRGEGALRRRVRESGVILRPEPAAEDPRVFLRRGEAPA